jgi:TonB family protein
MPFPSRQYIELKRPGLESNQVEGRRIPSRDRRKEGIMYGQWNLTAAQQLKRAYVAVNVVEIALIAALLVTVQLSRHVPALTIPDADIPIIQIPYLSLGAPPSIEPGPVEIPVIEPNVSIVTSGIPLPVADADATDNTLGTQHELDGVNQLDPRLKPDPGILVKVVPDTMPKPASDTGNGAIPEPGKFVKTSRKPEVAKLRTPDYPNNCRVLGIEGTATVNLLLNLDVSVMDARIARSSSDAGLDSAAVRAGRQCRFIPALDNNQQPVRVWVAVPFVFRLDR